MAKQAREGHGGTPWPDGGERAWPWPPRDGEKPAPGRPEPGGPIEAPEVEEVIGGPGDDALVADLGDDLVDGGAGRDTARIVGTGGADAFELGRTGGADDVSLYLFAESPKGEEVGRVRIEGIEELVVLGRGGDDALVVRADVFGEDEVIGFPGPAFPIPVTGVERVVFYGGRGDDMLDATEADGPVVAYGGAGDDRLVGGAFADRLVGGPGDDVLQGGGGADRLRGGPGDDVFVYADLADVQVEGPRVERIGDFAPGEDVIDLSAIDADPTVEGDQAFRFLGSRSPDFQLLQSGDLYYDPEDQALKGFVGDFIAFEPNFAIELPGVEALDAGDLIL